MIIKPYFGNYEIANLFRFSGPGLGNLLFPLCRSYIYASKYKAKLLPPIWPSIKPGALLRGEKEKRGYTDVFKLNFLERTKLQLSQPFANTISEDSFLNSPHKYASKNNIIVKVAGLRSYFDDLLGHQKELLYFILMQATDKVQKLYHNFDEQNIGIHIRLGDYNEAGRVAISWYAEIIKGLQENGYHNTNFIVFSDGTDNELKDILKLPNCKRIDQPNALADILRLSKCQLIIGSNSTFSAWAAFLGDKPFIRHEKFYLKRIYTNTFEGNNFNDFLNWKNRG